MQMKHMLLVLIVILVILAGAGVLLTSAPKEAGNQLVVGATIFPLADIVRQVGGEEVTVVTLVPPRASPHTFAPTPSDIRALGSAQALFYIGQGFDNWALGLVGPQGSQRVVTVDQGITIETLSYDEEEGVDPHYWLDPLNAMIIASTVAEELTRLDPRHATEYQGRLAVYVDELRALHEELGELLQPLADKELLLFHDSWGYFARAYNLKIAGVFEQAPGKEPTPQALAKLHEATIRLGVTILFTEPQLPSSVVAPFVRDLGLSVTTLDPLGGEAGRNSYIELLRFNAQTIFHAFQQ